MMDRQRKRKQAVWIVHPTPMHLVLVRASSRTKVSLRRLTDKIPQQQQSYDKKEQ
jgi:hypothetical protein